MTTSTLDRIRAGQRDSRIAAADIVARADLDATVAVMQGAAQRSRSQICRLQPTKRQKVSDRCKHNRTAVVALAVMLLLGLSACGHCESQDEPGSRWCIGGT